MRRTCTGCAHSRVGCRESERTKRDQTVTPLPAETVEPRLQQSTARHSPRSKRCLRLKRSPTPRCAQPRAEVDNERPSTEPNLLLLLQTEHVSFARTSDTQRRSHQA